MVVIPLLIFLARVLDVSLGTIRIIFISKGMKYVAPMIGFFEILIWLMAISQIMANLTNIFNYLAYAGGFATGTFLGIIIESKIAMGYLSMIVVTKKEPTELIENMESSSFETTTIRAKGKRDEVGMVFAVVKRKKMRSVLNIIKEFDPDAFYSIEDIKDMRHIHMPIKKQHLIEHALTGMHRKKAK
ncbi:MAG: DUF2179 domain-containing protein [Candidatus Aenigmarchaeota archaeon]|nr:DUF2179 domain-containing protein [Candidatus Aenigmarchaeota archaeon]